MTAALLKQLNDSAAVQDWAGAAQALSGLCALAGKQAERREISALLAGRAAVYGALASDEPKARKNAARLLSAIGTPDDAPALIAALGRERTRFVVPSLLLALGAAGGAAALEALCAYAPPTPQTPEEEKHCAEIRAALEKALARLTPAPTVALHALRAPRTVLLKHPEGFADALLDELRALGLPGKATAEGVLTSTQDLDALYGARCFGEALLPCGQVLLAPQEIALAARQGWTSLCAADEAGAPELPYRIELRDYPGDRAAFIRAVAVAVGGQNRPSGYVWELRIRCTDDGRAAVSVKPTAVQDARFAYRHGSLPASIHPATAAAIARMAAMRLRGRANLRVYDPCCGSGTLLVEAARAMECAALMGTDISQNAVHIARENAHAADCRATILQKDCRRFAVREPFDLVLSNLPFGNRVGSHAGNETLYRDLAARLPALLAPDGLAVLYTMEGRLLERCLRAQRGVAMEGILRTEAGGLNPRAFFVRIPS